MARYPEFPSTPAGSAFSRGRAGERIKALVIHSAVGSDAATHATFASGRASTHFIVHKDGTGHQFVDTNDTAWATGRRFWNRRTVSTELEGGPLSNVSEALTTKQYAALVKWAFWSLKTHGLGRPERGVITGSTITGNLLEHNQIVATQCPSGRVPWTRLIRDVDRLFDAEESTMPSDTYRRDEAIQHAIVASLLAAATRVLEKKHPTAAQLKVMQQILDSQRV